ncbi:hypothetical protein CMI37_06520 [Candidatus Pacearchaeota archaeon]|nr:hypothetical protein [Candidatus Pacearchaeota archaeon]
MNKKYVIIPASRVASIDFSQVLESSADTLRYSLNGAQTFIKYRGTRPSFLDEDDVELTHTEIMEVLNHEDWAGPPLF